MPSARWRALRQQVQHLRVEFLPTPFNALGIYANKKSVQAQARAFVVLCHAEVEAFLEDRARAIVKQTEAIWLGKTRMTPPLVFMLSCLSEGIKLPKSPIGSSTTDMPQRFADAAARMFQLYYRRINENHGVREQNLLALFAPLGLPFSVLGSTLLPNLDNFGTIRGVHAHQSGKAVVAMLDPETEHKRVTDLVQELTTLDDWLSRYKRQIR